MRWKGRWGGRRKGGRPHGSLSYWNEQKLPEIDQVRRAFKAEHNRAPSLRELAYLTGVAKSTLGDCPSNPCRCPSNRDVAARTRDS